MQFNQQVYQQCVSIVHNIVSQFVPKKTVKLGPKDPPFVTPVVKLLLKKRSRLRRRGRHDDADELSLRIKGMITANRADSLQKLSNATSKQLWTAVNKTRNSNKRDASSRLLRDPNIVNAYFAKIAPKDGYDYRELDCFRRNNELHVYDLHMLTNVEVEGMLRYIKSTASGCDNIPAWLLRSCSYELADIVTYILNLSFSTGKVPTFWLNALVAPVPKVSKPTCFYDFRPISVTTHLSRLAKKITVRCWLRPAISFEQRSICFLKTQVALLLHWCILCTESLRC